MNTVMISGKRLARLIQQRAQDDAQVLEAQGVRPTLSVVVSTDDQATHRYVRALKQAAERAGLDCRIVDLGRSATDQMIASVLKDLSVDPSVNGIILQTPLPPGVSATALVNLIAPEKDIDGAHPLSLRRLTHGEPAFAPAAARAVVELLDHAQIPVAGRHVVIIADSTLQSVPLSVLLLAKDAIVTVCDSTSGSFNTYTQVADVVVVAAGRKVTLTGNLSSRSVVIDAGATVLPDGSVEGDVDLASVVGVAAAVTPVPDGIDAVTSALLILHTTEATHTQSSRSLVAGTVG